MNCLFRIETGILSTIKKTSSLSQRKLLNIHKTSRAFSLLNKLAKINTYAENESVKTHLSNLCISKAASTKFNSDTRCKTFASPKSYYSNKSNQGEKLKEELEVTDTKIKELMDNHFSHFRSNPYPKPTHKRNTDKELEMQLSESEIQTIKKSNYKKGPKDYQKLENRNPEKYNRHESTNIKEKPESIQNIPSAASSNSVDSYNDFLFNLKDAKYIDTRISNPDPNSDVLKNPSMFLEDYSNSDTSITQEKKPLESELTVLSLSKFNHVIFTNALEGNVKQAEEAFNLMKDAYISPTLKTYDHMLFGYANVGDLKNSVSIFKEIEKNGLQPSIYSYGGLIKAYIKSSRLDDAYKVYEIMKTKNVMPNESIYNQLLMGCLSFGDTKRAWGTYEHMRYEIANPSVKTMTIMINACALDDQVERALVLLDEMIANGQQLNDVTFNSLINACAHRPGYLDRAFDLLVKMELTGFKPDYYTYNTIIYACARNKNLEMARFIFNELVNRSNEFLRLDESSFTNLFWTYASHIKHVNIKSRKNAIEYLKTRGPVSIFFNEDNNNIDSTSDSNSPKTPILDTPNSINDVDENIDENVDETKIQNESIASIPNTANQSATIFPAPEPSYSDSGLAISKLPSLDNQTDITKSSSNKSNKSVTSSTPKLNAMFLRKIPENHKMTLVEAGRIYKYFIKLVKSNSIPLNSLENPENKKVTTRLLNSYLAVLSNHGEYYRAWKFYCTEFQKLGAKRDGWTVETILFCCDIQRDIEKAWVVWKQFKKWRKEVELRINIKSPLQLETNATTEKTENGSEIESITNSNPNNEQTRDPNEISINEWFHLPEIAVDAEPLTFRDREFMRKVIGNDQLRSALDLLTELKHGIKDHERNELNSKDFSTILSRATQLEDDRAAARLLALCRPTKDTLKKQRNMKHLNKKWGTEKKFEVGIKKRMKYRNMYPEEFENEKKK
ncbi:Pentatricopeptide repeat-containing protein [Smittium culicis]|uniref:Pentatricopeptide repeat-containing protein n=1 Tax=Smittium culicis TaxID=133412 RepID=A0A1R1YT69_9FUNG|nr:Pentatricopeptide repeat-containing protein [Smittium culicis]